MLMCPRSHDTFITNVYTPLKTKLSLKIQNLYRIYACYMTKDSLCIILDLKKVRFLIHIYLREHRNDCKFVLYSH